MIAVGDVRPVSGGYGLMLVVTVDHASSVAEMRGHGPKRGAGQWFKFDRLGASVGSDVITRERREAAARGVACNNPDCWCVRYR